MPPVPPHPTQLPNQLLTQLEAAKNGFDAGHATLIAKLLAQLSTLPLNDPHQLIRFHECLLFLRAFPHAPSHVPRLERLLIEFHRRVENLRTANADLSPFDDFETSGIAGTTMQDTVSFDVARWLVHRIARNVDIAWNDYWDDYQAERSRGDTWPRFIPLLEEDADVEANIPWTRWLDLARGRHNALPWLLSRFAQLPLPASQRAELYDSLRLPLRWRLDNLKLSRTRHWTRPRTFYFHDSPLIRRSQVSLSGELARPAPQFEKLSPAAGESVMHSIREIMLVRYRELYGTTLGDPRTVFRTHLGRGVVMHFWGLPPHRRLPLRAYIAGYTMKNGVPINYIEAIGLCEWIEVGFNTFYTYRQGETAWIYAQALRCLRALTHAQCFSVYPYQIGQSNDEAIDSGAFWFYRKLGFRSGRLELERLARKEEQKIAGNRDHRTQKKTLKRLAEAHVFYELDRTLLSQAPTVVGSHDSKRTAKGMTASRVAVAASHSPASAAEGRGPWDTFSVRNLALRVNRRMAREFQGDSVRIRQDSLKKVTRALRLDPARWTQAQQHSLENWSLVLALIPDLAHWSRQEKYQIVKIIRAKSAPNEMSYLRQTQHHPRLRAELLRLGSQ